MAVKTSQSVLDFWFDEIDSSHWWAKDPKFDKAIKQRFGDTHVAANRNELFKWRTTAQGRLAEIIVLDQFSRNIFRDSAKAFASDALALCLAQEAVAHGYDKELGVEQRSFIYMPYMHSESKEIHHHAINLFTESGLSNSLDFEMQHKIIIDQFGRYPHRNEILGRESTAQEIAFLKQENSGF